MTRADKRKRKINERGEVQVLANIPEPIFQEAIEFIDEYNDGAVQIGRMSMSSLVRVAILEYIKNHS